MSQTASASRALLRVSVQGEGRRLDIGIPAQLPLIELMPGFARNLGVLDPNVTYTGYALQRADGTALDVSRGSAEQGVLDGELLTLSRGGLLEHPRIYDDIVEAVIDATSQHRPWTPSDSARTALAANLTLLGICAILLLSGGRGTSLGSLIAGGGTLALIAVSAAVARMGQPEAGHGLALAATAFGALAGYLFTSPDHPLWGMPLAAAGICALVVGAVCFALTPANAEYQLIPMIAGLVVGLTATITVLFPGSDAAPYAIMVAAVATLSGGIPWLILTSTRIRVISPQTDAEVFNDPGPVDADDVARRAITGARALTATRLGLGLCVLTATPLVASTNVAGAILCTLAFLGTMFPARQAFARSHVIALMSIGTLGLAVTGVTVALSQPSLRIPLLVSLIAITAVTVTVALLSPAIRARSLRLADTAEVIILAVMLPLGVIAAGLA